MLLKSILALVILLVPNDAVIYDRYKGTKVTDSMLAYYNATGRLPSCTIDVKPCDAKERRRVDGTCNSLNHPSQGAFNVAHPRLLSPVYFNGSYPRKAVSGKELPLPRVVRTKLLCEGISVNTALTQAVPGYGIFVFGDIGSSHDIRFFLQNKTDCCTTGRKDYMCAPNYVPEDDPVHRFSGIRCLNMTRPIDFQYLGCTNDTVPAPIEQATAVFDLSPIYNAANKGDAIVRSFKGGQLETEVENGITWPPNGTGYCPANSPGGKCFKNYSNALLDTQMFSTWFLRLHNYFAKQLAIINRCWDDDQLFFAAREMNIAFAQQMYIYEWLALLIGKKNLVKHGIASNCNGFRDIYDNTLYPQTTLEYTLTNRWFHILQDGHANTVAMHHHVVGRGYNAVQGDAAKRYDEDAVELGGVIPASDHMVALPHGYNLECEIMYDTDGTFLKEYPIVNSTFRTEYLGRGKNIVYFTQGKFRQPCRQANEGVDPYMAEMGLPYIQRSVDIPASDLHKNRLFGLRPYIDYVHHCFGYKIKCWNDLKQVMDEDRIMLMQDVYEDVRDIDLMAGLWSERIIEGGYIPPTLACLFKDSILKTIKGDRHWYERHNRPQAFTHAQLREIRKASLSLLLCSVGDGVTEVQRHAFMNKSPKNPLVSCDKIPKINFNHWANCTTESD